MVRRKSQVQNQTVRIGWLVIEIKQNTIQAYKCQIEELIQNKTSYQIETVAGQI